MIFDKNQTEFINENQKRTWAAGVKIVPLALSLAKITDPGQKEMFTQMYNFTMDLFSDLYEHTQTVSTWDCIATIGEFCKVGKIENKDLVFPWVKSPDCKEVKRFAACKDTLARHGVYLEEKENESRLTSTTYPELLLAYATMYESSLQFKVNHLYYLAVCDFRIMEKGFAHSIDDIFRVLSDKECAFAQRLHQYALSLKIKPIKCIYPQRVLYKYKGKRILDIQIPGYLNEYGLAFTVHPFWGGSLYFGEHEKNKRLLFRLEEKVDQLDAPEKYREFFLRYIRHCTMCVSEASKCPRGVLLPLWGKQHYLCQGVNFTTCNVDEDALDFFMTILRMRKEVIDEGE